ncbi:histidine kinase [Nostoc sp.]
MGSRGDEGAGSREQGSRGTRKINMPNASCSMPHAPCPMPNDK